MRHILILSMVVYALLFVHVFKTMSQTRTVVYQVLTGGVK
jgi:hypothetical protein